MTRFKSIGLTGIIVATSAIAPAVMAVQPTVELFYGPYAYSVGGEFTAVTAPSVYNANYAASTLVTAVDAGGTKTGFETFCVQTQVDFTPYNWGNTTPYNYGVSLSSIGTPDNFALSEGTAYLYWQFATGQLAGYNYTDTATRIADAGQLQAAIWALQGNQSYGGFPTGTGNGTTGNVFYNDALNYLGVGNLTLAASGATTFGVEIMNLTVAGSNPVTAAQNQLVYTGGGTDIHHQNVPDAGSTVALLGIGVSGLAFLRRRR